MTRFVCLWAMLLATPALAAAVQQTAVRDAVEVYTALKKEAAVERQVIADADERKFMVENFVKSLTKLDDAGLGDMAQLGQKKLGQQERVLKDESDRLKLQRLQEKLNVLVQHYQHDIRPILLNNVKLMRGDYAALYNKASLSKLFFSSRANHRTKRPVAGIFYYQQDIGDSFFSSQWVDAGILRRFPAIEPQKWVQDTLTMDVELVALMRLHRAYQDGVKPPLKAKQPKQVASVVPAGGVIQKASAQQALSPDMRARVVQKFMWSLKSLDETQPWADFKHDLMAITARYQQQIKGILVNNINFNRQDLGSQANRGALIALFYANQSNHKTGLPVSGKLKFKQDVSDAMFSTDMQDVGILVDNPALAQDAAVEAALKMEDELAMLLKEHQQNIRAGGSTFLH